MFLLADEGRRGDGLEPFVAGPDVTLAIDLKDGRRVHAALDRARGTPDHALSDAQLIDKFADCAVRAARPLSDGEARDLAVKILTLEECGDVGELFQI